MVVENRSRDHDRQPGARLLEERVNGEQAGFQHQRVERGFRQQQVDSALHQRPDLRLVVRHHLVESHIATAGIFDVNPHRELLLGRADAAGDEPGPIRILAGELVSDVPGQLGGCSVQFVNVVLKTELLERQRCAVERVGFDDVGARVQVSAVNFLDQPRLRRHEHLGAVLQIAGVPGEPAAAHIPLGQLVRID